jgi:hypothetical protein
MYRSTAFIAGDLVALEAIKALLFLAPLDLPP